MELEASCTIEDDVITLHLGKYGATVRVWEDVDAAVSVLIDQATDFARHRLMLAIGRAKLEGVGG